VTPLEDSDLVVESMHITQAITDLGEKCSVRTTRAIFNKLGSKVVEKGATVNARLYERLMAHVLDRPLEECVTSLPIVTCQTLKASAAAALEVLPLFHRLCIDSKTRTLLLDAIGSIPLPPPIAFQLTLASEVRPELFQHLIRTALFAAWMTQDSAVMHYDLTVAGSAGLLHDIGMLHLDPILLTPQGSISEEQKHQLYVHPKISTTLIERHHAYPKEVLRAVMEHHEFLDGSGYPRNLTQNSLSPLGCILSLAELFTAMHSPERNASEHRLWVLLRMNQHRYAPLLVGRLLKMLEPDRSTLEEEMFRLVDPVGCLHRICVVLSDWPKELHESESWRNDLVAGMTSLNDQAAQLQRTLANVGATSVQLDQLGSDTLDEQLLGDLTLVAREGAWQLRSLARQARRRWLLVSKIDLPDALTKWLVQVDGLDADYLLGTPDFEKSAAS
jgi:HD-GYP domain-containing protein (c-di-GMP phosphodiesterase class II)